MPDPENTPATDAVKLLAEFLYEPELNLSADEIRVRLKEAHVDIAQVEKRFRAALAQARGRSALATAQQRREAFLSKISDLKKQLATSSEVREHVRQLVEKLFGQEATAAVAWRNFEKATDDDLRSMIEDMTLLEELEKDDQSTPTT